MPRLRASARRAFLMTPETLARLHAAAFPEAPWTKDALRDLLARPGTLLITDPDGRGFLMAQAIPPEAEILTLAIVPDHHRTGVGSLLIRRLLREAKNTGVSRIFLEVASDNVAACALYRKCGFAVTGQRARYYSRKMVYVPML